MSFADKAHYYVETMRWPVFPVSRNKVPCIKGGVHRASCSQEQIQSWTIAFPRANVGLACGKPSGIVVVDIDGPVGEASWDKLVKLIWWQAGAMPAIPQVLTGKGRHLYFGGYSEVGNRVGSGNRNGSVLGKGIDVRGDGGSAILPPSVHESGQVYEWVDPPHLVAPPMLPLALVRVLAGGEAWPDPRSQARERGRSEMPPPALEKLVDMVRAAQAGERNHTLNVASFLASKAVAAGTASRGQVIDALSDAAVACGLTRQEAKPTILSGLRGGGKKAR